VKYVREHLNEKFTDESDPIKDMGIGLEHKFNAYAETVGWKNINKHINDITTSLMSDILDEEYDIQEGLQLLDYILKTKIKNINPLLQSSSVLDSIDTKEEAEISIKIIKVFMNNNLDIHYKNDSIFNYSIGFCENEDVLDVPEFLLKRGANINNSDIEGVLLDSMRYADSEKVRFLLNHGLKLNKKTSAELLRYGLEYEEKDLIIIAMKRYIKLNKIQIK
jgi:hypothetical protein